MNTIEKKNLVSAKFDAERAASGARELLDSKFVEDYLSEKEQKALKSCAEYLTALETKFNKLYNKEKAWEA